MDLENTQQVQKFTHIGRILLAKEVFPRLEAFSGNALYCDRGILTMNKYKTVKEVCELTGLTRKHLYYFHHKKVVQAVAYANYSVEGNDGYKLYDDSAIEKLQMIALYYQLGLQRREICNLMLDPNYDSDSALDTLLVSKCEKKRAIERQIAAIEYLKLTGSTNKVLTLLKGMSLEELGKAILIHQCDTQAEWPHLSLGESSLDTFINEFIGLVEKLMQLDSAELHTQAGDKIIGQILATATKHLYTDGLPFVLGFFVSATNLRSTTIDPDNHLTTVHTNAVIQYYINHSDLTTV